MVLIKPDKDLIIIPNFATEEKDIFIRQKLQNHAVGMKEFSDIYQLGITDEKLGDKPGELFSPHWANELTKQSNIVILIDFIIVLYIPETLTDFQYRWLITQKGKLQEKEDILRAIIYQSDRSEYISSGLENISKIDLIYQYIEEKRNKKSAGR